MVTSALTLTVGMKAETGFGAADSPILQPVNYAFLHRRYEESPGLVTDKLKSVLEFVWSLVSQTGRKGIIFAYDEAQNLSDNASKEQYPLSVLLDVFQSIQRKGVPFMLALSGLPTLFPKLVEARTYAERMFRVVSLKQLSESDRREAITKPTQVPECPLEFSLGSVEAIADLSAGYPYFIQFICREVYDIWIQRINSGVDAMNIPIEELTRKLDSNFFAGRWAKATDRQRELLGIIAELENSDGEFTVQEIVQASADQQGKAFTSSHANQMLAVLTNAGLIYKNRHGKYSFAVPLMAGFIRRQLANEGETEWSLT